MNFSSTSTYNIARTTAVTTSANNNNLNSFSQSFTAEITAYTNSGWAYRDDLRLYIYQHPRQRYNASVPLLNPSIARQLFKKKNGELRQTVFDLLNQNTSVSKTLAQVPWPSTERMC